MAAEVEERIVQMKFDNAQFEKGAKQSLETLDKLDGILDRLGEGGLDHLSNALSTVERRFSTLGIAGMTAIQKISNSVLDLSMNLLTMIPRQIISGGTTRAMNIEQAKFQLKGLGIAWDDVKQSIDYAVNGTAYGMDEAAKAAAQFAASKKEMITTVDDAGVTDMAKALRAISGVAAMTNSSYDEIANIFTGISGTGHVMTQDLRMLEGRGLNAAAKLAEVLSDGPDRIKYTEEQIREMISKGEIDFLTFAKAMDYAFGDHATAANETYTGSLSNMKAALSRIGADFVTPTHEGLRKVFNELRLAFNRARQVTQPFAEGKFTDWMERLSRMAVSLSSRLKFGWLESLLNFSGKAGDKVLSTIEAIHDALTFNLDNELLVLGNEKMVKRVINIKRVFRGLKSVFQVLSVFAKKFWASLVGDKKYDIVGTIDKILEKAGKIGYFLDNLRIKNRGFMPQITAAVEKLTNVIKSAGNVVRAAGGVIFEVLSQIFGFIKDKISNSNAAPFFSKLSDAITNANNKLAGWLDTVREYLKEHPIFENSLETLGNVFGGVGKVFSGIFTFFGKIIAKIKNFVKSLSSLKEGGGVLSGLWETVKGVLEKIGGGISNIWKTLTGALSSENGVGLEKIIKLLSTIGGLFLGWRWIGKDVSPALKRIRTTLGGFVSMFHEFINIPTRINGVFGSLAGNFRSMRELNQAKALKELAITLVLLAGALWVIASIPEDKLTQSVGILTMLIVTLGGLMALINKLTAPSALRKAKGGLAGLLGLDVFEQSAKLFGIAAAMIGLGVAIIALAGAMKILSTIDPERLQGTIAAFGAMVLILGIFMWAMSTDVIHPVKLLAVAAAMLIMSAALIVLVLAVLAFSAIPTEWLNRGVIGLVKVLAVVVVSLLILSAVGPMALAAAAALLIVSAAIVVAAVGLVILAGAMWLLDHVNVDFMKMLKLAGALVVLGLAGVIFGLGGLGLAIGGAGLFILAIGLGALSFVKINGMELLKIAGAIMVLGLAGIILGLGGLGLALGGAGLLVLAIALNVMNSVNVRPLYLMKIAAALIVLGIAGVILGLGGLGLALGGAGLLVLALALNLMNSVTVKAGYLAKIGLALIVLGLGGIVLGLGALGLLVGGIGLISLASGLRALEGIDFKAGELAKLGGALLLLGLAGIVMMLGGIGLINAGEALATFGTALPPLSEGLKTLEDVTWDSIAKAFATLAGISLGELFMNPEKLIAIAPGFIAFGDALPSLSTGLKSLETVTWESIAKAFTTLAGISLGELLLNPEKLIAIGPGFVAFGDALPSLSEGLKSLENVTWDTIIKAFAAMAGITLGELLMDSEKLITIGLGLRVFGNSLTPLSTGLQSLENVTWDTIGKAFTTLAGIGIGNLLTNTEKLKELGPGFTALGTGLNDLLPSMQGLAEIEDPKKVTKAVNEIADASKAFGKISVFDKQADVEAISKALGTIIPAVLQLNNIEDPKATSDMLDTLGSALHTFGSRTIFGKENNVAGIGEGLEKIIPAILQLEQITDVEGLSKRMKVLGDALNDFGTRGIFSKKQDLTPIGEGLLNIAAALASITDEQIARLESLGVLLLTDFSAGMEEKSTEISNTFTAMIDGLVLAMDGYSVIWTVLGGNITAGIANGILSRTDEAVAAMQSMASSLATSFTVSLEIHSPSRVMQHLAGYIPAGVAKGISDGTGEVTDAMITAMSPAMMVLMALMSQDYDFSPTITPVVDLTNVSNAANAVGGMFGNANISAGYDSRISGIVDNVGSIASEMGEVTNITNNSGDTYNFNIYASEGMDENSIADAVMARIQTRTVRRGVAFG